MRLGLTKGPTGKPETFRSRDGSTARFARDGSVREIHSRDMTIIRSSTTRTVIVERQDHSRLVVYRPGYGYVERPFAYGGYQFAGRTYFFNGRPYPLYYQRYPYGGLYLNVYRPYYYYQPGFYGWAYNPWYSPVRYSWGWGGSPWYGYYGYYFNPYPVYPSAAFWLTDFLIASSLQAAYTAQVNTQARAYANQNSGQVVLTPEVKQAIADEVQAQIALEKSEQQRVSQGSDVDPSATGLPQILGEASPSHPRIFVVASSLQVSDSSGREWALSEGDVLRLSTPPPGGSSTVYLQVFASKNPDCPRGTTVAVGMSDLQEMQNHMRANIDQGLQQLQKGQGGLPSAPDVGATPAPFARNAPPVDQNVGAELQQQAEQADTAEQGVLSQVKQADVQGGPGATGQPAEISIGQTVDEVVAIMGSPKQIVRLRSKQIYVYANLKITFVDGQVSDVQ